MSLNGDDLRDNELGRKFIDRAAGLNVKLDANDWWLGWQNPKQNIDFHPETLVGKNGLMRRLLENPGNVVNEFAEAVEELVETFVGPGSAPAAR